MGGLRGVGGFAPPDPPLLEQLFAMKKKLNLFRAPASNRGGWLGWEGGGGWWVYLCNKNFSFETPGWEIFTSHDRPAIIPYRGESYNG